MYCETSQSKTLHILRHIFQSDKRYIWKKFIISLANQFASQLHTFSFAIYVLIWLSFYFRNIYKTFMSRYFWGLKELHFSRKVVFPKSGQNRPKISQKLRFFECFVKFCDLVLSEKFLLLVFYLHKSRVWENSGSWLTTQNALSQ